LPKNLHISTLILQDIHERIGHGGRNHILSQLRKRYLIINVNSAVRKIISKCVTCRCMKGRFGEQKMGDLPAERLHTNLPPFSNVGVDYFGPFENCKKQ
ncbi:MAG: integrase zinc binding domain-containing protein, partial [Cetobacterium sp.]